MSEELYIKSKIAQIALESVPPLIRKTILDDFEFQDQYGFSLEPFLEFSNSDVSIKRSVLFDAIRDVFTGTPESKIVDADEREWIVKTDKTTGNPPSILIVREQNQLKLSNFAVLHPDKAIRLQSIESIAIDLNLPNDARNYWETILSDRPLHDREYDKYIGDLHDTPIHISRSIRSEIASGQSSISSLIPSSRRYYERLVGSYDGSGTIKEYATGAASEIFSRLLEWNQYDGFLYATLLSSHSSLSSAICVDSIDAEDLVRAYEFLVNNGDRLSQIGALEIGIRILPENPHLEPLLLQLIESIRDDDIETSHQGIKLLSSLFILVDGELSRIRLFSDGPPFYRRLASLAHASIIHRQLLSSGVDNEFCEWAWNARGDQFYWQSLCDMRLEPRWNPEYVSALNIKMDFFGRIIIAASQYKDAIKHTKLIDHVLGENPTSLQSLGEYPLPYLPGPLEGAENSQNALPEDLSEAIDSQLTIDTVGPESFVALVNSALIFQLDNNKVELAVKALKSSNYHLKNIEDRSELLGVLGGLAIVAATFKNTILAEELRILLRRYWRDDQYKLSIEDTLRICLIASASHEDFGDWCIFVGEWLTELSFGDLQAAEGRKLHSHLQCLLLAVPELWVSCSKADAALKAYNESH